MSIQKDKRSFRKVLFLEIAGFLSLAISVAVIFFVVAIHTTDLTAMILPFSGLALVVVYIFITISYMRKDLHRIHELHTKTVYSVGRFVIYAVSVALIVYAGYLFVNTKDFWNDISVVVVSVISMIVASFAIYYTFTLHYLIQHEHLRHAGVSLFDLLVLVIFPVGLVVASVYIMFSQKAAISIEGKPDFIISSEKLIQEFEANDSLAKAKYVGKSVQFSGLVSEIAGDSAILLMLNSGVEGYTTNCGFDKSMFGEVSKIKPGDSIGVKCSCSGITSPEGEMDLLSESSLDMVRCTLLIPENQKP